MSLGGNGRGRTFFKEHGWADLGADKIPQKVARTPWQLQLQLRPRSQPPACAHPETRLP